MRFVVPIAAPLYCWALFAHFPFLSFIFASPKENAINIIKPINTPLLADVSPHLRDYISRHTTLHFPFHFSHFLLNQSKENEK